MEECILSIPKIIHYVWFSPHMPVETSGRIEYWKRIMPDYEFIHWNSDNFPINDHPWVLSALENKKWAFATDYVRLWALKNYGGIYLDTDVQVLRAFDDLLILPYFIGMEKTKRILEAAILGVQKECVWISDVFAYYQNKTFAIEDKNSERPLPEIILEILVAKYGLQRISKIENFNYNSSAIQVFPSSFFSPKKWNSSYSRVTCDTYCIHLFDGAWLKPSTKLGLPKKWVVKKIHELVRCVIGDEYLDRLMFSLYAK